MRPARVGGPSRGAGDVAGGAACAPSPCALTTRRSGWLPVGGQARRRRRPSARRRRLRRDRMGCRPHDVRRQGRAPGPRPEPPVDCTAEVTLSGAESRSSVTSCSVKMACRLTAGRAAHRRVIDRRSVVHAMVATVEVLAREMAEAYDELTQTLSGLTDAEFAWEPVDGSWRVFGTTRAGGRTTTRSPTHSQPRARRSAGGSSTSRCAR
jgi:hypothetical protein